MADPEDWQCDWEAARRRAQTLGARATLDQRLQWLEQMLRLAHHTGALQKLRDDKRAGRGVWAKAGLAESGPRTPSDG